jgi:uncharacterized membrane protein
MVTEKQGMFVFIVGLLIVLAGVGGVEQSITDAELTSALLVALVGLGSMYCGTVMIRRAQ